MNRRCSAARIEFAEKATYAVSGVSFGETLPEGLQEIEPTPGLFAAFAHTAGLKPNATSSMIRNILEDQHSGISGYEGHDLYQILGLYPNIKFLSPNSDYYYTEQIERVLGLILCGSSDNYGLDYSIKTSEKFYSIIESGSEHIPYPLIIQSLLSLTWEYSFTNLYRCVEQLFGVPHLRELKSKWPSVMSINKISELIEDILSWRPREEDALSALLNIVNSSTVETLSLCVDRSGFNNDLHNAAYAAKRIYKLRNSCVHYRPWTQTGSIDVADWDEIIYLMLSIVLELYDKLGEEFHGSDNGVQNVA